MIEFTPRLIQLLEQDVIETFYCVKVGNILGTTYHKNVVLGGITYFAETPILSVDMPKMTSVVDKASFKISFADPEFVYGSLFEDGMNAAPVSVRLVLIDQTTGQPELSLADTFLIYAGYVDAPSYSIDTNIQGEAIGVFSCGSPMADLDATRTFYTSKDFLRTIAPDDSAFDQVYEGSGVANLRWGKA